MAQNDALAAQEMAGDCRLIAAASQHDSASMKCIALVTMFFLPGTFVSSLLSIPLFDWDADSQEGRYRRSFSLPVFAIFMAMTLPLMAVTFSTWGIWMYYQKMQGRRHVAKAMFQLSHQQAPPDEVTILALKRHRSGQIPDSPK